MSFLRGTAVAAFGLVAGLTAANMVFKQDAGPAKTNAGATETIVVGPNTSKPTRIVTADTGAAPVVVLPDGNTTGRIPVPIKKPVINNGATTQDGAVVAATEPRVKPPGIFHRQSREVFSLVGRFIANNVSNPEAGSRAGSLVDLINNYTGVTAQAIMESQGRLSNPDLSLNDPDVRKGLCLAGETVRNWQTNPTYRRIYEAAVASVAQTRPDAAQSMDYILRAAYEAQRRDNRRSAECNALRPM